MKSLSIYRIYIFTVSSSADNVHQYLINAAVDAANLCT